MKKILSTILLISVLAPSISSATGVPVVDVANTTQSTLQVVKDYGLDTLATTLAQTISSKVANKIFNKANGGASGDSSEKSVIQNFTDYFGNLSNQQIDKFVTDIGISNNPFAGDIAKGLITSTQKTARGQGALEAFNLDRVVGTNWKEFATDASVGGWDGILALSNPANTNIGANILAQEDLARKIEQAKELEKIKLTTPGTRPQGKCTMDFRKYKSDINRIKKNKATISDNNNSLIEAQNAINNALSEDGAIEAYLAENPDIQNLDQLESSINNETGITGLQNENKDLTIASANTGIALGEEYGTCLQEMISNPVGLVTSTIDGALKQASDRLTQGDELGELIGGVLTTMLSTFIKSGVTALQAEFRSNRDSVGGPEQLIGTNGQTIPWTNAPQTIVELDQEFPIAMVATEKEVADLRSYIQKVTETTSDGTYASLVTSLDQCIPGPDYGYKNRLKTYISKQTSRLEKRKNKGKDSKKVAKNNALENIDASLDAAKVYTDTVMNNAFSNIPGSGIMLAQVATIDDVANRYQDAKSELTKKQITLNLLYSMESSLQTSIQSIKQFLPGIPALVPFTESSWDKMTSAQKSAALLWAKKIHKLPETTPFSASEWNTLSTVQKTSLVTWAKQATGKTKPDNVTERDFVLAAVFTVVEKTPVDNADLIKKEFVVDTTWSVWTNPEQYMEKAWVIPGNSTTSTPGSTNTPDFAKIYLTTKNKIRADYQGIQNDVSLPYTAQRIATSLRQLESIIDETRRMRNDCQTMRSIIAQTTTIDRNSPEAHNQMKQVLLANKTRFTSQKIKEEIETGNSILLKSPVTSTTSFSDIYGPVSMITCENNICYNKDIELLSASFGDGDNESTLLTGVKNNYNTYQSQPVKNIWELIEKKPTTGGPDTAFCGFNKFLKGYPTMGDYLPNSILDGGKPIECSDEWIKIGPAEFRNIIFGSDEIDLLN